MTDACKHERFTEFRACDLRRDANRGTPMLVVSCADCGKSVEDFTDDERKHSLRVIQERSK